MQHDQGRLKLGQGQAGAHLQVIQGGGRRQGDPPITTTALAARMGTSAPNVTDTVKTITKTATRELKKLTEPLKALRENKKPKDDSPTRRDTPSSGGGDSAE